MGIRLNKPHYRHGDWNAVCDVCGFQFKASQLKPRWDGLMVCAEDWEPQQDQDFLRRPRAERNNLPFISPRPAYTFIEPDFPDYEVPTTPGTPARVLGIGGAALGVGNAALGAGA